MSVFRTLKRDIRAIFERDPAARSIWEVLSYPGLHAILYHRAAHALWKRGIKTPARWLSHWSRWLTGIEIHPGATIGQGFFIDHGMGVVIGETAVIGEDVLLYHQVTLGGTSLRKKKRHPTIGNGVVISPGAKVLGDITVGDHAKIGPNSVVRSDVAPGATVVGIPGRAVQRTGVQEWIGAECDPCGDLDHGLSEDPEGVMLNCMLRRLQELEDQVRDLQKAHPEIPASSTPAVLKEISTDLPSEIHSDLDQAEPSYAQGH